jgi:hypothetical protein
VQGTEQCNAILASDAFTCDGHMCANADDCAYYGKCDGVCGFCPCQLAAPPHGQLGTCGGTLRHGQACTFECDAGYVATGSQPTCGNGGTAETFACEPAAAAHLPGAGAGACSTGNSYDDSKGQPGACAALLAAGVFSCASPLSDGVEFHMVCLRACGQDLYDSRHGEGACAAVIGGSPDACATLCSHPPGAPTHPQRSPQ